MNARTPEAALALPVEAASLTMGFGNLQQFEFMQRAARMITESTLVPALYRRWVPENKSKNAPLVENVNALSNAIIALNLATRMRADVLAVMQNLNIIENRPSWASTFVIGMINACGRFTTLRFVVTDLGDKEVTYAVGRWEDTPQGSRKRYTNETAVVRNLSCVAICTDIASGAELRSPTVDVEMAVREGWYGRDGSKWQTMPELMLHYRCGAFFGRLYASDLLMGLQTAEELRDLGLLEPQADGTYQAASDLPPQHTPPRAEGVARPQSRSASAVAAAPAVDEEAAQVAPAADQPSSPPPPPAPAATPAQPAAEPASPPSPPASEGSRKFLLNKFKVQPAALLAALLDAGYVGAQGKTEADIVKIVDSGNPASLAGLTDAQFAQVKAKLPKP
ncbi:MAG: hypothetical protein LCH79_16500 [Proteobacteria bacterium]|nr:hypothetical protein [Pseudomonadota bacterium]